MATPLDPRNALRYSRRAVQKSSCAKHLTVESCTVVKLLTVILSSLSPPSLFHNRLKTFLFCKLFPPQPFLFFFRTDYMDSPDCLLLLLSISVSYVLVFLFYTF